MGNPSFPVFLDKKLLCQYIDVMENSKRRDLLRFIAAGLFVPATVMAHADSTKQSFEENYALSAMKAGGFPDFILMNKRSGQLHIIKDGAIFLTTPAISGKTKGDVIRGDGTSTPAGIFSLTPRDDDILFKQNGHDVYLIHGTSAARQGRMSSPDAGGRRISSGCINVPDTLLPLLREAVQPKQGNPVYLVVLPDFGSIRDYLAMPEKKPENSLEPSP